MPPAGRAPVGRWSETRNRRSVPSGAEQALAVVVAEQEGEAGEVLAQRGQVVAVGADEAPQRGVELAGVGAGELVAQEGEQFAELSDIAGGQAGALRGHGDLRVVQVVSRWARACARR